LIFFIFSLAENRAFATTSSFFDPSGVIFLSFLSSSFSCYSKILRALAGSLPTIDSASSSAFFAFNLAWVLISYVALELLSEETELNDENGAPADPADFIESTSSIVDFKLFAISVNELRFFVIEWISVLDPDPLMKVDSSASSFFLSSAIFSLSAFLSATF
jgi:hypothetical protein